MHGFLGLSFLHSSVAYLCERMKSASLSELKKALKICSEEQLLETALLLIKYKKENKELLTYVLFESGDEAAYIRGVKLEIETLFSEINDDTLYWAKKSIRKILRHVNKHIRYSGIKSTEVDLRIYFCQRLNASGISFRSSTTMMNLYDGQLKKVSQAMEVLHEDLRFDFKKTWEDLLAFEL